MRCLGCGGTRFIGREMFELDIEHTVLGMEHRQSGPWWARRTEVISHETRLARPQVVKRDEGYAVACVACGLRQLATPEGMKHAGAETEDRDTATAPPARDTSSEEKKPALRTTMDRDIPMKRRRPYA